jgi:uncharacterized LabA/DUF88 family protein
MINMQYTSSSTSSNEIQFSINGMLTNCQIFAPELNWAFIDMQNIYKAVKANGWKIDWKFFRQYLWEELQVTKAIVFMGEIKENKSFYCFLEEAGFTMELRKVMQSSDGKIDGGNVDADLTSYIMDYKSDYRKAVIVADDGDYCNTIKSLQRQDKLGKIISSHTIEKTSHLIKEVVLKSILSIESIKHIIEYKSI